MVVPRHDPTLIHADPPVWGRQACLCPINYHLWPFRAVLRPYGAPQWPFRTRERVPTHCPGCARTWSNLDPRWSTSLELPGLLMGQQGHLWPFWAILGPYGGLNSEKIHKIRTATCSTITYKTKKNNKTVREVKLRKCLNSKVTGLISTLCPHEDQTAKMVLI